MRAQLPRPSGKLGMRLMELVATVGLLVAIAMGVVKVRQLPSASQPPAVDAGAPGDAGGHTDANRSTVSG